MSPRHDHEHRVTKETDVEVDLLLDGSGTVSASTGIPFFDHMLEQLGKHGGFDLTIAATGDLESIPTTRWRTSASCWVGR
jgi:imidazoleglycerol phosphate dehydratase HisB